SGKRSAGILPLGLRLKNRGSFCSPLSSEINSNSYGAPASASAASAEKAPEPKSPYSRYVIMVAPICLFRASAQRHLPPPVAPPRGGRKPGPRCPKEE